MGLLHLTKETMEKHKIPLPSLEVQRLIVGILVNADHEVDLLRKTLELAKQQKRGLMQKLLTGQWRVKTEE